MSLYNELTFTAITADDFRYSARLPASCDICKRGEAPFMRYELRAASTGPETEPQESGFSCKRCVPGLVLRIVQESERNVRIATCQPNNFDYQDELLERDFEKQNLKDISEYERDMTTLILRAMTPAFLLFRFKGKSSSKCKQCGGTPLLKYLWHHQDSNERGICCHQCAFNFCGMVLASCIDNESEAERLMQEEAQEEG
jgi:hypothetical protein